ncbi:hypothetical protein [Pseudomonas sp.]|uniref:hypothetical protein n=1 Tax=Pseudomonas sp. TaxID=306 RepID=UPI003FD7FFFD
MDNQKVRAHLRKGEIAVKLLESLGYSYDESKVHLQREPRWVAPAKSELELFKEQLTKLITPPEKRECPVRKGDRFGVTSLPAGHFLNAYMYRHMSFKVASSEWIAEGSQKSEKLKGFSGWVVHFNNEYDIRKQVLWLPLSCIKVASNADF